MSAPDILGPAAAVDSPPLPPPRRPWSLLVWMLLLGLLSLPFLQIPVDNADGAGMLAHLHAFWTDGDLLYDDEYQALKMLPLFSFVTAGGEGVVSNHWPSGATWLQAPAYLLGERASLRAVGQQALPPTALWIVVSMALRCAAVLLSGIAAFALASVITAPARRGRARAAGWGTLALAAAMWLGTPLAYYALDAPARPHAWGFCATALLVYLYVHQRPGARTRRLLGMGLVTGLAISIRPQLAPLALLSVHAAWERRASLADAVVGTGLAAAAACVWVLPGLMMQLWIYDLPGSISAGTTTHFVGRFLTSSYHGVLPWHPLVGVALGLAAVSWGVTWQAARKSEVTTPAPHVPYVSAAGQALILVLLAHQVWLDAGYRPITPGAVLGSRTWAGGTGFGARKLVDVLPLLVPGLTAIVAWREQARQRLGGRAKLVQTLEWSVFAAVALCVAWSTALLLAALVDLRVTSEVLGSGSLPKVASLGLRGAAWKATLAQRAIPGDSRAILFTWIALPLLLAWVTCIQAARRQPTRTVGILLALLAAYGVFANVHTVQMLTRSEAVLQQDPTRMPRFAAQANPRHAGSVGPVNAAFEANVRAVLGDGAVPPPRPLRPPSR